MGRDKASCAADTDSSWRVFVASWCRVWERWCALQKHGRLDTALAG